MQHGVAGVLEGRGRVGDLFLGVVRLHGQPQRRPMLETACHHADADAAVMTETERAERSECRIPAAPAGGRWKSTAA